MTLALSIKPDAIAAIDAVIKECTLSHMDGAELMQRAFTMAAGMRQLRKLITAEAMKDVMELQGTAIGFRTDKDSGSGYQENIVKDCLIEATLRGLRPIGNEFNIISGRCYATKEGFARLVREYPGLTDLQLMPGIAKMVGDSGAIVLFRAKWKLDGVQMEMEREIPVKKNAGMGQDAIIGKATRKMLCAVYERLTGSEYSLPEGDVSDVVETKVARSMLTDTLPAARNSKPMFAPEEEAAIIAAERGDAAED